MCLSVCLRLCLSVCPTSLLGRYPEIRPANVGDPDQDWWKDRHEGGELVVLDEIQPEWSGKPVPPVGILRTFTFRLLQPSLWSMVVVYAQGTVMDFM